MRDLPLPRGQAPALLPSAVLIAGQHSPGALAALAKRTLYPPALWPEELDDRTAVKGALTIIFENVPPYIRESPVLFGRIRGAGLRPPAEVTYGPVRLLGHNAQARGWHPFLLSVPSVKTPKITLELRFDAPVSRLLLMSQSYGTTW